MVMNIEPKVDVMGFGPEKGFKRSCKKINNAIDFNYNESFHNEVDNLRAEEIRERIIK